MTKHIKIFTSNSAGLNNLNSTQVGVDELVTEQGIELYPNPTSSFLTIRDSKTTLKTIEILNAEGKKVKTFATNTQNINVPDLKSGTYFLKSIDESGKNITTQKFIKQ